MTFAEMADAEEAVGGLLEALGYRRTGRKLPLRMRSAHTLRNIALPLLEKTKRAVNKITHR